MGSCGATGCSLEWASVPAGESGSLLVMIREEGACDDGYEGAQAASA